MALTREERKLLHQKSKQPTSGTGKPDAREGKDGDISYRKIEGSGTVQYVKQNGDWIAIGSSGEMPAVRIIGANRGGGGSSTGSTNLNHSSLLSLDSDDHDQYVLTDGTRAFSGNLTVGTDGSGHDVTFYSATSGDSFLWDSSEEKLTITGTAGQTALDVSDGNVVIADTLTASNFGATTLRGKLTAGSEEIEGSAFDINGGTVDSITSLTVANDVDIGNYKLTSKALEASDLGSSGGIIFANSDGLLTVDSDITFSTDTLTVTKIAAYELTGKLTAGSTEIEGTNFDINGGTIDGTPIGANSANTGAFTTITASTSIDITGSTGLILSNDETITNAVNGTVLINGEVASGTGSAAGVFKSNGNYDLTLKTGNSTTGSITITDGANGNIAITPNGTGYVPIGSSAAAGILGSILSAATISALEIALDNDQDATSTTFSFEETSGNLLVTNGFVGSNASFNMDDNKAKLINTASANGYVYLPLTTVANEIYEVIFDVVTGGSSDVEVCLSSSTSWNVGSESGSVGAGTNYGLIKNYKADDTTSYLIIRLVSAINTQWAYITNINVRKAVVFTGGEIGSASFVSGFAGSGWKIDKDATADNEYDITVDNMFIRGRLSVYELLIQQIRATNGAVFVTSAAKVNSTNGLSSSDSSGTITFQDPSGHGICPFATNDIIMMQRVVPGSLVAGNATAPVGDIIKKLVYKVSSVSGATATVVAATGYTNANVPVEGDDFVRIGNTSNSNRQGSIYLTSDDSNAPFIDIKDNIDSYADWHSTATTEVRLGKLDGITDTDAGLDGTQSNSYGLYSSNVFLKGHISANSGAIAGWNITAGEIYKLDGGSTPSSSPNNGVVIDKDGGYNSHAIIKVYSGTSLKAAVGNFDDNKYGIAAEEGEIGNWVIDTNSIHKESSSSYIGIASTAHSSSPAGTSPQFFAGATGTQGQSANIAFASNGKIYGNGIYVKQSGGSSVDYLITASRIFGNGSDGDLTISSSSQTTSTWISGGVLQRDIYANNLTISASVVCYTNGYRIFVRNTLTLSGSGIRLINNGQNGNNGNAASGLSAGAGGFSASDYSGSDGGLGGKTGSLLGGPKGGRGGNGGTGANAPSVSASAGAAGTAAGVRTNVVRVYTNSAGARGGDGTGLFSGAGAPGTSAAAGTGSATSGNVSVLDADLTYVIAMRDFFSVDETGLIPPLYPATGSSGGGGGGGGGVGDTDGDGEGSGGGGGGQGGGAGGHVMLVARVISGTQSHLKLEAIGGDGGDGGNGALSDGSSRFTNGGKGAGGNGGDGGCVTIISGTDPSSVVIDVSAGDPGANASSGSSANIGSPASGQPGTSIVIHC